MVFEVGCSGPVFEGFKFLFFRVQSISRVLTVGFKWFFTKEVAVVEWKNI